MEYLVRFARELHEGLNIIEETVQADNDSEAVKKACADFFRKGVCNIGYSVIGCIQINPYKFNCIEDMDTDRVYKVVSGSSDGTLEEGVHVWVSSNSPDKLSVYEKGDCLEVKYVDSKSIFSAEFEIDQSFVCMTVLGRFSQAMPREIFNRVVIIR